VSVTVRVEGVGDAQVITAIAAETESGRPFRAILGAQIEKTRPREFHQPLVIDTTLGQGGQSDGG
jgi:hypothetical protein